MRIWDPETRRQRAVMEGHHVAVNAICPVSVTGRSLLATAGGDGSVRIWELQPGACLLIVHTHHSALAVAWTADLLAIGLATGILVIKQDTAK